MVRLPDDVHVLVRGWLHGNVVALSGARPTLIDTGYHTGAAELLAFVHAAAGSVERVLLTHVHSDHAGGVASVREAGSVEVLAHPAARALVHDWVPRRLWLDVFGQAMPRFDTDASLVPGDAVDAGQRRWRVIDTPGHATGGVALLDEADGILISGDALWQDGFGMLVPWIDGADVFEGARAALDRLAAVDAAVVIPGHGAPFDDLTGAVERARGRLEHLARNPDRLAGLAVRTALAFWRLAHPAASEADGLAMIGAAIDTLGMAPHPDDRAALIRGLTRQPNP